MTSPPTRSGVFSRSVRGADTPVRPPAKTRQVYPGCVFTQHKRDDKRRPVRDHNSTTYVCSFDSIDRIGPLLRQEAIRRGLPLASKVVLLTAGAAGLVNMGHDCFRNAVQIVDFCHALEDAGKVLMALLGSWGHPDYKPSLQRWTKQLLKDQFKHLIATTRRECCGKPRAAAVEKELGYFVNNVGRMRYGTFRDQGFVIGPGVGEAGCKTVIGARSMHASCRA